MQCICQTLGKDKQDTVSDLKEFSDKLVECVSKSVQRLLGGQMAS